MLAEIKTEQSANYHIWTGFFLLSDAFCRAFFEINP